MQASQSVPEEAVSELQSSVLMPIQTVAAMRGQLVDAVEPLPDNIDLPLPPPPGSHG
jgi:hypothetical protein